MKKTLIKFVSGLMCGMLVLGISAVCHAKKSNIGESKIVHVSNEIEFRSAVFKSISKRDTVIVLDNDILLGNPIGCVGSPATIIKNGHSLKEFYNLDGPLFSDYSDEDSENYTKIGIREAIL